jgi:hypothetical protein
LGGHGGFIALQIDDDLLVPQPKLVGGFGQSISPGGVIGPGQDRLMALGAHGGGDFLVIRRDNDASGSAGDSDFRNPDDHRFASEISQCFVGQPG